MRKLISVLSVMLILFASVWCMMPAMAAEVPVMPAAGVQNVGGCAEHSFGGWSQATTADCTTNGYVTRSCYNCGFVEVSKYYDKFGHQAAAYSFDKDAATHTYICYLCNETITEACTLELTTTVPECATAVTNTYTCTVCHNSLQKTEAPTHNVAEWKPSTGNMQHEGLCSSCNQTVYENCELKEITVTADCLNAGKRILACECGRVSEQLIPAFGHNVETWLHIEGTSIHAGHCTRCLASLNNECVVEKYTPNVPAPGSVELTHSGTCSVCLASFTEVCEAGEYVSVAGTGTHQANCADCGRSFADYCTPDENGLVSNNNGTHSAVCSVCKTKFTKDCTATIYTQVENTETHSTVCSECEGTYTGACEVKTWTPSQIVNAETGEIENADVHKGSCELCAAEYEKDCTVETYTLDVTGKTCTGKCTACGDTLTHESNLGTWKYDAEKNSHTIECATCKASATHTVAIAADSWEHKEANGAHSHETLCTECNTAVSLACEFEKDAANAHKQSCKVCGFSYEEDCVNFVKDKENSTEATCTEDGYTYYVCKDCGKRNEAKTLVHKAKGHEMEIDKDAEITSDDESHTVSYVCKNCTVTETKTEEHTFGKVKAGKDGKHTYECKICGKVKTEDCKPIKIEGTKATCTQSGMTDGSKCEICEAVIKEQTKIDAKGHDFKYHSTTATCAKPGKDIFKCICGLTNEVDAAANGKHSWRFSNRVPATSTANGYVEYTCRTCSETYREVLVYSVHTGVEDALAPVAAIVLLSGAAFLGVKKLRKDEGEV